MFDSVDVRAVRTTHPSASPPPILPSRASPSPSPSPPAHAGANSLLRILPRIAPFLSPSPSPSPLPSHGTVYGLNLMQQHHPRPPASGHPPSPLHPQLSTPTPVTTSHHHTLPHYHHPVSAAWPPNQLPLQLTARRAFFGSVPYRPPLIPPRLSPSRSPSPPSNRVLPGAYSISASVSGSATMECKPSSFASQSPAPTPSPSPRPSSSNPPFARDRSRGRSRSRSRSRFGPASLSPQQQQPQSQAQTPALGVLNTPMKPIKKRHRASFPGAAVAYNNKERYKENIRTEINRILVDTNEIENETNCALASVVQQPKVAVAAQEDKHKDLVHARVEASSYQNTTKCTTASVQPKAPVASQDPQEHRATSVAAHTGPEQGSTQPVLDGALTNAKENAIATAIAGATIKKTSVAATTVSTGGRKPTRTVPKLSVLELLQRQIAKQRNREMIEQQRIETPPRLSLPSQPQQEQQERQQQQQREQIQRELQQWEQKQCEQQKQRVTREQEQQERLGLQQEHQRRLQRAQKQEEGCGQLDQQKRGIQQHAKQQAPLEQLGHQQAGHQQQSHQEQKSQEASQHQQQDPLQHAQPAQTQQHQPQQTPHQQASQYHPAHHQQHKSPVQNTASPSASRPTPTDPLAPSSTSKQVSSTTPTPTTIPSSRSAAVTAPPLLSRRDTSTATAGLQHQSGNVVRPSISPSTNTSLQLKRRQSVFHPPTRTTIKNAQLVFNPPTRTTTTNVQSACHHQPSSTRPSANVLPAASRPTVKDGCITSAGGETGAGDSSAVLRARRVTAKPVAAMAMNMPMAMSMSRTNPVAPADNVVEPVSKPKVNNGINHIPVSTAHVTLQSRPARGRSSLPPQAEPNVKEEEKQQPEAEMQALLTTQPSVNGLCTPPMKEFDAKMEEEEKPAESGIVATMCSRDGDNEIVFSKLEAERMEMDVVSAPVPALRGEENPATAIECMKDALSVIPVRCEEICTSAAAITMTGTKDSSTGTLRSAAEPVQKQEREQWSIDQPENKTNIATQAVSASVQPSPPPPPTSSQSPSSTAPTPRTQQPTKMGMEANLPQAKSIKGVGTAAATPSPDDTSKEKDQGNKGDDVADVKHGVVNKGCTSPAGEKVQQRSSIRPEPKHEKREAGGGESGDGPVSESTVDGVADVKSKSGDADVKSKSGDADVLNHSPPLEPLPSPPPSPPHPSPPVICSAISPTLDTASVPVPTAETTSAPPAQTTGPPAPVTTTQEAATSQVPAPESAAVAATVETAEASSHAAGDQQPDDVNNNLAISIEELTYYPPVWSDNDNDRRNDEDGGVGSVDKNEDEGEQSDDKENKVSSGNKRNKKKTPTTTRKRKRSRALTPPSWDGCVQEEGNEDEDDGEDNMDRDPEFRPSRKLRAAVRKYKARQQQEAQAKTTPPRRGRKRRGVRSRGSCSAGAGMVGAVTRNGAGKTVIAKTNASANEINEAATGTAVMETSGTKANGGQGSTPKDKTDGGRSQHL